ncbi:MAG: helix-turn-helix transcriptional regulator [Sphingomonadaceae bacterium]|nr:helix-turn-helix transcriptional regulator [Sphingomonadaceae bacterium]
MQKYAVHVIDQDAKRRNVVARMLYGEDFHAEIYDTLDEFVSMAPESGVVLTYDDKDSDVSALVLDALKAHRGYCPAVLYSEDPSPRMIVDAIGNGACDYLYFPLMPASLSKAVLHAMETAEENLEAELERREAKYLSTKLSKRERDVLKELLRGSSNKVMAKTLGISPRTIEIHRANALRKMDAPSTADAVRKAIYAGLDGTTDESDQGPMAIAC